MNPERVLVVEDSEANRQTLSHLLKKLGFEVVECENGLAAWNLLSKEHAPIDMILSDIMMPEMDGIELLKRCRETDEFKATPFFLITAVSDKDYMAAAKAAGVDGYVVKPLTFQRLKTKMQEVFPAKKLAA